MAWTRDRRWRARGTSPANIRFRTASSSKTISRNHSSKAWWRMMNRVSSWAGGSLLGRWSERSSGSRR
jgi:hypothetical protein